jgi:hypothetical protein
MPQHYPLPICRVTGDIACSCSHKGTGVSNPRLRLSRRTRSSRLPQPSPHTARNHVHLFLGHLFFFIQLLSTHFYKSTHFKKLQAALDKEYRLKVRSTPLKALHARVWPLDGRLTARCVVWRKDFVETTSPEEGSACCGCEEKVQSPGSTAFHAADWKQERTGQRGLAGSVNLCALPGGKSTRP